MKKNIKILYILLLVCTVILPFKVKAVVDTGSSIHGSDPGGGDSSGGGSSNKVYMVKELKGVRVTFVDKNGNRINNKPSVEFVNNFYSGAHKIIAAENKYSRIEIVKGVKSAVFKEFGCSTEDKNNKDHSCKTNMSDHGYKTSDSYGIVSSLNNNNYSYVSVANTFSNLAANSGNLTNFLNTYFGVTYDSTKAIDWYLMVEPLITVAKDGYDYVVGTPTELSKYAKTHSNKMPGSLNPFDYDFHVYYNYLYFTDNVFVGKNNNITSTFKGLEKVDNTESNLDLVAGTNNGEKMGYDVGLIWLGMNAKSTKKCSEFANKTSIWSGAWIYNPNKANTEVAADASDATVREKCGINACSEDTYNKNNKLNKVTILNKTVNCCNQYPEKGQTRVYRDHPECYSCIYSPKKSNATCEENKNTSSIGDSFKSSDGYELNNQTCVYKIASGGVRNASKNLVTRRNVSSDGVCKVVCTENVEIKFPLLSSSLYRKGSYIEWPINIEVNKINSNSILNNSRLTLKGDTTCWYYVNIVAFHKMNHADANKALKNCITDVYDTFTGSKNVINYDLSGNFSVKYNDPEYGKKELSMSEVKSTDVEINAKSDNNVATLSKLKNWNNQSDVYDSFDAFVVTAEGITYTVTQSKDYSLDYKKGYMASYQGKYYTYSDFKGKVSSWSTNSYIDIGKGVLPLANKKYNNGTVSLNYKNIGGGSLKYLSETNTYSGTTKNNACSYKTIENDVISCECPSDTKNAGEILDLKMITESLTCNEAIEKYCNSNPNNPDNPNDMTVCPEDSPIEKRNRPIEKSCLNDAICKKLTCYNVTCKKSDGNYVYLNLDIQKEMDKDSSLSYEQAYKKAYEKNGCGGKPKYNEPGNIEYRVIDLKDPFPGNAAKAGSSLFNTNIKGRKPGSNWNSTTVVQKEILKNRGVNDDEIYKLTPLYEFELTPSVIKEIKEYNDKHSYDDFTLSCKGENKKACVASGFDFKTKFGIVKVIEQCKEISNLSKFNSCYNNDSLR